MQAWGIWGLKLLTAAKVDPGYINSLISLGRCQGLCGGGLFTLCHTCQNECNYRKCFLPLKILLNHFFVLSKGLHMSCIWWLCPCTVCRWYVNCISPFCSFGKIPMVPLTLEVPGLSLEAPEFTEEISPAKPNTVIMFVVH